MDLSRRGFLAVAAAIPSLLAVPVRVRAALVDPAAAPVRLLSARGDGVGGYRLTGLDSAGRARFDQPLPGRGHGIAVHPSGRIAVCVARRPGDFLMAIDLETGEPAGLQRTPENLHCCGHGVFSADGGLFYTSENAFESGAGCIGVWDVSEGLRRLGDLPSHGIDPHELLLAPDGERLIVANGGVLTRPETGRTKLNLDTMAPSLAYVDRRDGRLVAEHRLPPELHRLSIRHLALARDGSVCAALQYEGPPAEHPPLVAFQRPDAGLELAPAPAETQSAMRNYCGSVAADPTGDWLAVSSPRGNLITFWGADRTFRGSTQVADGCGVAPGDAPGTFYLTSGMGTVHRYDCRTGALVQLSDPGIGGIEWDNHLARCA